MLYITTRNSGETYTSHWALTHSVSPDGGRFLPLQLPEYSAEELNVLCKKPFSQIIADILNTFFSSQLTGPNIDLTMGRNLCRMITMNHRIAIAELWHNPDGAYDYLVRGLHRQITGGDAAAITDWFWIATDIAVFFGLYGELKKSENLLPGQTFDVCIPANDFAIPMAAWYARKMGLPIEIIVCTCDDNSPVWDLIHRGSFSSAIASDTLQLGIERLIYGTLGAEAVRSYLEKCSKRHSYIVEDEAFDTLSSGFFCAVAGESRANTIINSVYRNNTYFIDPHIALCFGGLQDYRAKNGGGRLTLLPAFEDPGRYADVIKDATGVSI